MDLNKTPYEPSLLFAALLICDHKYLRLDSVSRNLKDVVFDLEKKHILIKNNVGYFLAAHKNSDSIAAIA